MENETPPSRAAIQEWMVNYIASVIDLPPESIPADKSFHEIGVDSAEVVIMTGVMEEEFAIEIQAHFPFEHPTLTGFLDALQGEGLVTP